MALRKEENKIFSKRNIISFFIILIMVSSILAIWQGSTSSDTSIPDYNNHKVQLTKNYYIIASDFGKVYGYTYPSSLEAIPLQNSYVQYLLSSDELFILFYPQDENIPVVEVLRSELGQRDFPGLGKTVGFALTTANETYQYPVLSCTETSLPTLYLHTLNTTSASIYQNQGCIVLEAATWQELVELKDRLVYTMYGVME